MESEKELWLRIRAGEERAALEIVAANCEKIWPIARRMAKEGNKWTPDDLYQEAALAMVRFAMRWEWREGISFWAAVRPRVNGSMKDFLRRKADAVRGTREQPLSLDASCASDPDGPTLGEQLDSGEQPVGERYALPECLSKQERAVLELRVFTDPPVTVAKVAKQLGVSGGKVQQLQRKAMRALALCG